MKAVAAVAAIVLLLVAPIVLRPHPPQGVARTLVIISPHGESTRSEFGRAFGIWASKELGFSVEIDWRTPGGTSDITRLLEETYRGNFRQAHHELSTEALAAFNDAKVDAPGSTASDEQKLGRMTFLASETSVGMDLWWGGGLLPHADFADKGFLVDAGMLREKPEWFTDEVIPQKLSGETVYDKQGRYYGACFSAFGICSSPDRLALLTPPDQPRAWADLGEARFLGQITMVDPTRSAAIVSALERLIQQRMAEASAGEPTPARLAQGWADAFVLIKRIAGNARALSDGASKAVRDVVRGDATAAICIDFHAKAEAEYSGEQSGGTERLVFAAPTGGTSISADPISMLRGAPHADLAKAFIRFVLSPEGQRLWDYKVGEPGGPIRYAMRRMAVRRDVYTSADRARMSDPDVDPFALAASFTYHPEWTSKLYRLIGPLTRAAILDPREELIDAWSAIIAAGGPEAVPAAWAEFTWMPFGYADAKANLDLINQGPPASLTLMRSWTTAAQGHYREAARLARASRVAARASSNGSAR